MEATAASSKLMATISDVRPTKVGRGYRRTQITKSASLITRDDAIADHLQQLHQNDQQRHSDQHVVGLVAEVAVAIGEVAEPTGTDRAAHGGVADQGDRGD